jgi:hypothetical protein
MVLCETLNRRAKSACDWYRSSKVTYPDKLHSATPIGGMGIVFTGPLLEAIQESGRLNKIAAGMSAVAAALVALSAACSAFFP